MSFFKKGIREWSIGWALYFSFVDVGTNGFVGPWASISLINAADKNDNVHLGFEKLARWERHQQTNESLAWQWEEEKMGFWGWRWEVGGRCPS